ncbi:hypothetical protein [Kitasatospora sp. HPMI-4]|uniref:hypothetical protein n=1 Tax=Kitasatospora sp. HPMI-4 TaxID=3448443 RepID=UPI003F1E3017
MDKFQEKAQELMEHAKAALGQKSGQASDALSDESTKAGQSAEHTVEQEEQNLKDRDKPW